MTLTPCAPACPTCAYQGGASERGARKVSAGEAACDPVTKGAGKGKMNDVSDPRERLTPGVRPNSILKEMFDMATIPPTTDTRTTPTSVYRYYDVNGVLLYVGITSRASSRQREHNSDKAWWPFVTRQEVEHYPTRNDASTRERELIRQYRPPFNRQHNPDHEQVRAAYMALVRHEVSVDATDHLWDRPRGLPLILVDHSRDERGRYTYLLKSNYHEAARFLPYFEGDRWAKLSLGNAGKWAGAQAYIDGPDVFVTGTGSVEPTTQRGFLRLKFASQKPPRVIPASVTLSWSPKDNLERKRPRNRRKRVA